MKKNTQKQLNLKKQPLIDMIKADEELGLHEESILNAYPLTNNKIVMKNIHILPTDKPSRLYSYKSTDLYLHSEIINANVSNSDCNNQNIYITSDEEIKQGDWGINLAHNVIVKPTDAEWANSNSNNLKKIILTTDQSLDSVQSIDDDFLEWFVKTPSCEEVEVIKTFEDYTIVGGKSDEIYYKIIIPKEEVSEYLGFVKGVKWQMERSYSEEEVLQLLNNLRLVSYNHGMGKIEFLEWFEQFKKK